MEWRSAPTAGCWPYSSFRRHSPSSGTFATGRVAVMLTRITGKLVAIVQLEVALRPNGGGPPYTRFGGENDTVKLWDSVETGRRRGRWSATRGSRCLYCVAFSPDGQGSLASVGWDFVGAFGTWRDGSGAPERCGQGGRRSATEGEGRTGRKGEPGEGPKGDGRGKGMNYDKTRERGPYQTGRQTLPGAHTRWRGKARPNGRASLPPVWTGKHQDWDTQTDRKRFDPPRLTPIWSGRAVVRPARPSLASCSVGRLDQIWEATPRGRRK